MMTSLTSARVSMLKVSDVSVVLSLEVNESDGSVVSGSVEGKVIERGERGEGGGERCVRR